jgi:hypothetical protein
VVSFYGEVMWLKSSMVSNERVVACCVHEMLHHSWKRGWLLLE